MVQDLDSGIVLDAFRRSKVSLWVRRIMAHRCEEGFMMDLGYTGVGANPSAILDGKYGIR